MPLSEMENREMKRRHTAVVASLRQALAEDVPIWMRVTSDSMAPLFWSGDQLQVVEVSPEALQVGDVLVLDEGHNFLTHRLRHIEREAGLLYTRGDRSLWYDAPFGVGQVLGRVTAVRQARGEFALASPLHDALEQLVQEEEGRLACLRWPGDVAAITLWARVWHRLYFYRRARLVQRLLIG